MVTKKEETAPLVIGEIPELPSLEEAKVRQQALLHELNWLGGYISALERGTNGKGT